ncbi:MAG: hypothetical protein ACRC62_18755, partial [Microcoleus sp.]
PAIDYQKIASSTSSALQQAGLAKSNDVSSIKADIQRLGAQNYGPQFQSLNSNVSSIKADIQRLGAQNYGPQFQSLNSNVSSIKADIQRLGAPNYGPQLQTLTSGIQSLATGISALQAKGVDYAQINSIVTRAIDGKQFNFDYSRIGSEAAQAFRLPSDLARKSDIPADLARKSDLQAIPAPKIDFSQVLNRIPSDIARKTDVDAIPSKIPAPTVNLNPVLTQLSVIGTRLTNLDSRVGQVNLSPLQSQLTSLQSAISGNVNEGTNIVTNAVTNMGNTLQNFVTNNNTTIVNQINKGIDLNPASIIDPIKQHINTQVAAPLATTMDVLNVNDLKRGVTMSAESVIKASGFQQYGQSGTGTATNLIGLTAMIAAPLFFRAGFQKLGGTFDQSVMNPAKGKVKIDDALSASLWTFKQVDERLGLPNSHIVKSASGASLQMQHRNIQDGIEEINAQTIAQSQDLEVIERYLFAIAQDMMKLTQIVLQTKEDVDCLVDDAGFKYEEVKKSHPSHLKITAPGVQSSLFDLFQQGRIHYVARTWKGNADKSQILERIGLDTQIAAMSNKMEIPDPSKIDLPLDKSTARKGKAADDEAWKIFVSTMEEPPSAYGTEGNPVPQIQEIKMGTVREVPKPTNPSKKLGQ